MTATATHAAKVTQERLRELLHYNEDTGQFTWRVVNCNRVKVGGVAGSPTPQGYVRIKVDGTDHRAHRLAWLYVFGRWPPADLDHINGSRSDNRIANLRECSRAENMQNQGANREKKSGLPLGVVKTSGKYRAMITADGKPKWLGRFDTPELAYAAYLAAKAELHKFQPVPRKEAA